MTLIKKIIFFLILIFLFSSLTKNLFDYQKNFQFYKGFKDNFEKEKKTNISLKTEYLKKSDPNEIEKTIRNKLNLLRPDEIALMIPAPTPTPTPIIIPKIPIYQQWWRVFFKN